MAYVIVQRHADGTQGRYYEVNQNTGDPSWNATITSHATKFETYAQALAARDAMPKWMREHLEQDHQTAVVEPCRSPIRGLK